MSIISENDNDQLLGPPFPALGTDAATFWATARHQKPTEWKQVTIYETASVMIFPDMSALAIVGGRVRAVDARRIIPLLESSAEPDDVLLLAFVRQRVRSAA